MGVRFACHQCGKRLNIKRELAGKRGVCPHCSARFRIPLQDTDVATPLTNSAPATPAPAPATATPAPAPATSTGPTAASNPPGPPATIPPDTSATDASPRPPATDGEVGLLDEDPEAQWYVRPPSGGQYGPANGDVLRQWIDEGRVAATALLWRDGWPQWRSAHESLPGLGSRLPSESPRRPPENPIGLGEGKLRDGSVGSGAETASLTGDPKVGAARSGRSGRRLVWIGLLSGLVVLLLAALVYLLW